MSRCAIPIWVRRRLAIGMGLVGLMAIPFSLVGQEGESILNLLAVDQRVAISGPSLSGTLTQDDYLSDSGRRVQAWALEGRAGDAIRIRLISSDFDPYLFMVGPEAGLGWSDDDSGDGLNSLLCVVLPADGGYRLIAGSLGGGVGSYTLELADEVPEQVGTCTPTGEAVGASVASLEDLDSDGRLLRMGATSASEFTASSPQYIGSPVEAWTFEGAAGESLSVDLTADFDAYMYLLGPGLAEWLSDDDGAGCLNSRITLVLPESGAYTVIASALGAGVGEYELHVADAPGEVRECSGAGGSFESGIAVEDLVVTGSITVPGEQAAQLTVGDQLYQGSRTKLWTIEGVAGSRLLIEHSADAFDPYLYFSGPGFEVPLFDDDGAGGLNARLCVELPEDGTYRILSSSLGEDAGGEFTVSVREVREATTECAIVEVSDERANQALLDLSSEGRTIRMGDSVGGALTDADPASPVDGQVIQAWDIDVQLGWEVSVDLRSTDFDSYMKILGPGLTLPLENDDGAGGCDSRITFVPQSAGLYRVIVGSLLGGRGAFQLSASDIPAPRMDVGCSMSTAAVGPTTTVDASVLAGVELGDLELAIGYEVAGVLSDEDVVLGNGAEGQVWGLQLQAGDRVVVELLSEAFDANLYIAGPGIEGAFFDDDGAASSLDSRIEFTAASTSTYQIVVSTLNAGQNGSFRLRALRLEP